MHLLKCVIQHVEKQYLWRPTGVTEIVIKHFINWFLKKAIKKGIINLICEWDMNPSIQNSNKKLIYKNNIKHSISRYMMNENAFMNSWKIHLKITWGIQILIWHLKGQLPFPLASPSSRCFSFSYWLFNLLTKCAPTVCEISAICETWI